MKQFSLSNGYTGWAVTVYEVPAWALVVDRLFGWFTAITFHLLCCKTPEWTYKVRVGKPDWDTEVMADGTRHNFRSLGSRIWGLGQIIGGGISWKRQTNEVRIPLTDDQAFEIDPVWFTEYNAMMADE